MTVTLSFISILKGYCHCPDTYDTLILLMLKVNNEGTLTCLVHIAAIYGKLCTTQ